MTMPLHETSTKQEMTMLLQVPRHQVWGKPADHTPSMRYIPAATEDGSVNPWSLVEILRRHHSGPDRAA